MTEQIEKLHDDSNKCLTAVSAGEPEVNTVQPFTKVDLSQIPFHEIIRNFLILEAGNVPINPLMFLYPNVPRDEAFGKYYSKKDGGERHHQGALLSTATELDCSTLKACSHWLVGRFQRLPL